MDRDIFVIKRTPRHHTYKLALRSSVLEGSLAKCLQSRRTTIRRIYQSAGKKNQSNHTTKTPRCCESIIDDLNMNILVACEVGLVFVALGSCSAHFV